MEQSTNIGLLERLRATNKKETIKTVPVHESSDSVISLGQRKISRISLAQRMNHFHLFINNSLVKLRFIDLAFILFLFILLPLGSILMSQITLTGLWEDTLQLELPTHMFRTVDSVNPFLEHYSEVAGSYSGTEPIDLSPVVIQSYEIQPGDTLSEIAQKFDLRMDTLISLNQISDVRRMKSGTRLDIPNRDGMFYAIQAGDSISSIADKFSVSNNAVIDVNNLTSENLMVGESLFIPNATMDPISLKLALGELFLYPAQGRLSDRFGYRPHPFTGQRHFHNGVDWAGPVGTPVVASMGGRVVHIETQVGNYGKFIMIQHPQGFQTLYAHLDSFSVSRGQYVDAGQLIGKMGNTGRSTGPHLHFSIIKNGIFVDPFNFLH